MAIDTTISEALDRLVAEAGATPTEAQAARMLDLRFELGAARRQAAHDQQGPPPLQVAHDRFEGERGLPDIAAPDLDAEALASALGHHGGLVVRGLLTADEVAALREDLRHELKRRWSQPDDEAAAAERDRRMAWLRGLKASPVGLAHLLAAYERGGLLPAVRGYLGGDVLANALRVRIKRDREIKGIPWHQDAAYFRGRLHAVNAWTALTPVGEQCPSLELLPRHLDEILGLREDALAKREANAVLHYGEELSEPARQALEEGPPPVVSVLEPGDAIVFSDHTLHRTQVTDWVVPRREVALSWFFAPSRFPTGNLDTPLAV